MYIDSQTIGESWAGSESRKIADRLVRDVMADSVAHTRFVRYNDQAYAPSQKSCSKRVEKGYIETRLSLEDINYKVRTVGDISKSNDCLLSSLHHDSFLEMADALNREYPEHHFERSGLILYRPGNYLGWHTNSTNPVNRVYFVYSDTGESSFLSYDQATNRIRDDKDQPGWNIREFEAGDGIEEPLYWHAVYSYCTRISIGFRVTQAAPGIAADTTVGQGRHHVLENEWAAGLDLSPLHAGRRYVIPIRSLQHLLTPDRLAECVLNDIACPPGQQQSRPAHKPSRDIPGIVARNMANPYGKPYRLIDGGGRVARLQAEGAISASFYVLTFKEVMQHLVVQDVA